MHLLLLILLAAPTPGERALALAKQSPDATGSYTELQRAAAAIPNPTLAATVKALLENPAPTFMAGIDRKKVREALVDQGLLDASIDAATLFPALPNPAQAPQPFLSAPARSEHGHHSFPGGLAEHTALNLASALALAANFADRAGLSGQETLDRNLLVAAPILHDIMKPWTLQWRADGAPTPEQSIAGTSAHHVFGIAEAFHRHLSPDLIVAIAAAHEAPFGQGEAKVVGWLRAGAILARVDPVEAGVLRHDGDRWALAHPPSIEALINHLADHDFVLEEPSSALTDAALDRLELHGRPDLTEAQRRWARNRIEARVPELRLYSAWRRGGDDGLAALLWRLQVPLADPSDLR